MQFPNFKYMEVHIKCCLNVSKHIMCARPCSISVVLFCLDPELLSVSLSASRCHRMSFSPSSVSLLCCVEPKPWCKKLVLSWWTQSDLLVGVAAYSWWLTASDMSAASPLNEILEQQHKSVFFLFFFTRTVWSQFHSAFSIVCDTSGVTNRINKRLII